MTTTAPLPANASVLGQAVQAAYAAFEGKSYDAPDGWTQVASVTGWDDIVWKLGKEELFALVFTDGAGTCLVAIRGTNSDTDLYDDVWFDTTAFVADGGTMPPSPAVAVGFYGVYSQLGGTMTASMQGQLFALLSQLPVTTLIVTGHSLGGALAQLFAFDVAVSTPTIALSVVTFAAPMVGLEDWAAAYTAAVTDSVSVVNQFDVVPTLPPAWIAPNYRPVGTLFSIAFERSTTGWNPADDVLIRHEMDNYETVVTNILTLESAPWIGDFTDGVFPVTDASSAPSDAGAAAVAVVLEGARAAYDARKGTAAAG